MSDDNVLFDLKSPEQLVIDDVIPSWDTDFVVKHVIPVGNRTTYRVTFTSGGVVDYPVGVAIKVRK
jgi:hypothetical protein